MPPCSSVVHFPHSPFSPILSLILFNHLLLGLLLLLPCVLPFPSPFLHDSPPVFASHALTTSTSFTGLPLRFPPLNNIIIVETKIASSVPSDPTQTQFWGAWWWWPPSGLSLSMYEPLKHGYLYPRNVVSKHDHPSQSLILHLSREGKWWGKLLSALYVWILSGPLFGKRWSDILIEAPWQSELWQ